MKQRLGLFVRSIRFRLALWFTLALAVVMLAFSGFVYARQARDLNLETMDRLNLKVRKLQDYLDYGAREYFEQSRTLSSAGMGEEGYFLQEDDILALVGLEGDVVQKVGSISDANIQALARVGVESGAYHNRYSSTVIQASSTGQLIQEKYLFVVVPISANHARIGSLVLGSPVDPMGQIDRLFINLVLGNLVMLGIALAGGYWLADRAMHPVQTITRTARQIGETDLSRRLNLGSQDELGELADTFDGMLDRLQAAFDRQRQFTADASHELRTPLTIVNLETNRALASKRSPKEYEQALTVIRSENEFMTRLVNNLLTLSRMDAGQAVFNFEELDLSDVALEVVERLAPLAERNGVKLFTGQLPELRVSGDRQYLSQMIANLVENAIKYTGGPDPRVRLETGFESDRQAGGGQAGGIRFGFVSVEDNGPGIPAEHLPRIFDRFYQVDRARSHNPDDPHGLQPDEPAGAGQATAGSGLGLSIVQQIAQAHGGEVSVQSEAGQGTLFTVRLPLSQAPER
jgi:signal transduction histidine kinase